MVLPSASCLLLNLLLLHRQPNLKSVRELILKRGQAKIKKKRVPLTDNMLIEEHLGEEEGEKIEQRVRHWEFTVWPERVRRDQNLAKLEDWQFWSSVMIQLDIFFFFPSCRGLWYHLPGRPHSWNLLNWEVFQKSNQLSVAVPPVGGSACVTEQGGVPQGDGQAWLQRWCHQPAHPAAQLVRWALPSGCILSLTLPCLSWGQPHCHWEWRVLIVTTSDLRAGETNQECGSHQESAHAVGHLHEGLVAGR